MPLELWDILAIVWITESIITGVWKLYEYRQKKVIQRAAAHAKRETEKP